MRIKLLILATLFLLFKVTPVSAVSFSISNPLYTNDEVTIDVSLSGLTSSCPNNYCYLQAAFTAPSPTRYFGFTKNHNGQWYEYINSPNTAYIQSAFFAFLPSGGTWSGQITLKINPEDPDYKGPGIYNIKAWRYTGNSSNSSGSSDNTVAINLQTSTPTPTPSPSPIPTSALTPSPTAQPTSSFIINKIPSQIDSDQSFNVSADLILPNNKNTDYYLSGAFKKIDGTRYFGLTKINSNWIQYSSTNYLNQYKITTNDNGVWAGSIEIKPDIEDSDYKGSGDYIFKVARYSSNSSPTWSNETTVKINDVKTLTPTDSPTSQAISNPTPSATPRSTTFKSLSPRSTQSLKSFYQVASVAAATTSAKNIEGKSKTKVKNQKQTNPLVWVGLIFIFAGFCLVGYIYLTKNAKIPFTFRKRN